MTLLDAQGRPFPPNLTRDSFEVVIRDDGTPELPNGNPVLDVAPISMPPTCPQLGLTPDRMDAFMGGLNGYGWPGHRSGTFQNSATGVGTLRDKTTYGTYWAPWRIMDSELLAMFNGSSIAKKIVSALPEEMFRAGWDVRAPDLSDGDSKMLDRKAAALRISEMLFQGMIWGRLFGGSLNLLGVEDGRNPDEELNEDTIKTFHYINVVDRRFVWVQRYYSDMLSPKFGLPEIYLVTNVVSHGGMYGTTNPPPGTRLAAVSIHESRTIRHDGEMSDVLTRQQLAGWTWSVLQPCYDILRRFDGAFNSVDNLLADANQAVFKIKNLMEMIAQNQKDQLLTRMQLVDFGRSVMRGIMVDADSEDFERKPTTFAGIPELLDRQMMMVACAADAPVTRIFGRAPAGLNATGASDERLWLSRAQSRQENELSPKIKRVYGLMLNARDSGVSTRKAKKGEDIEFKVEFRPLWEPTEAEAAQRGLQIAQRNQILIDEGIVTPEQVALGMFGSGKLSDWITVDTEALQKSIENKVVFDPHENQPAPEGTLVNAAQQGEAQSPVVPLPLPGAPDAAGAARQKAAESPQRTTEKPAMKAAPKDEDGRTSARKPKKGK